MALIRFETARDVVEAFAQLAEDLEHAATDAPPLAFLRELVDSDTPEDAISFAAYVLPRREAVWWAAQCLRNILPQPTGEDRRLLDLAEAWVGNPTEERRIEATEVGSAADQGSPYAWLALAAGWSSGRVTADASVGGPLIPHLTAKAARAAVLIGLSRVGPKTRMSNLRACVDACVRIAQAAHAPS